MQPELVALLSQVPVVAAFMWFVLEMLNRFDRAQAARDNMWREFLEQERRAREEWAEKITRELRELAEVIREGRGMKGEG